jgi:DNA polymerase/3'-5' exonuclease PolX
MDIRQQVLRGIAWLKESGAQILLPHGRAEAERILAALRRQPGVVRAEIAGAVRRHCETVRDVEIVAACVREPATVAAAFARTPGVRAPCRSNTHSNLEITRRCRQRFRTLRERSSSIPQSSSPGEY